MAGAFQANTFQNTAFQACYLVSLTDGLKAGSSNSELSNMLLSKSDILSIGDTRLLSALMSLAITSGFEIGELAELLLIAPVEYRKPTAYTDPNSYWSYESRAYDQAENDQTTFTYSSTLSADSDPWITLHTWQTKVQPYYTACTLYVNWTTNGAFSDDRFSIQYTKDGGSTWLNLLPLGIYNQTTIQQSSVSLDADQDLTKVQVKLTFDKTGINDAGSVHIYDIWTKGEHLAILELSVLTSLLLADSSLRTMEAQTARSESIGLVDIPLESLLAALSRTDSLVVGDITTIIAMLSRLEELGLSDVAELIGGLFLSIAEHLEVGDASLLDVLMSVSVTEGISLGEVLDLYVGAIYFIELTSGLVVGDTRLAIMIAGLQKIEGVEFSATTVITSLINLLRTEGVVLNDALVAELAGVFSIAITQGLKFSDAPLLAMLASLTLTQAVKLRDTTSLLSLGKLMTLWLYTQTYHDVKLYTEPYHNVIIWTGGEDMSIRRDWQRGETVPIWAEVRLASTGALYNPDQGVVLTLTSPITGTAVVTLGAMTYMSLGKYVYYWNSADDSELGWYKAKGKAQDSTGVAAKVTIEHGGFNLED